jgi:hypothetical protein
MEDKKGEQTDRKDRLGVLVFERFCFGLANGGGTRTRTSTFQAQCRRRRDRERRFINRNGMGSVGRVCRVETRSGRSIHRRFGRRRRSRMKRWRRGGRRRRRRRAVTFRNMNVRKMMRIVEFTSCGGTERRRRSSRERGLLKQDGTIRRSRRIAIRS